MQVLSNGEVNYPSTTNTYRVWKKYRREHGPIEVELNDGGVCNRCAGWGYLENFSGEGMVYCVCHMIEESRKYAFVHADFQSAHRKTTIDGLQPWGETESIDEIILAKDFLKEWLRWPEKWILLLGSPGIGKTHILTALADKLAPWSLYITMGDFETKVFQSVRDQSLADMITTVRNAPFLFLDDLGMEYGSDLPMSALMEVIDFRYRIPSEYVTVVASNKSTLGLRQWNARMADRLMDKDISHTILFRKVRSWRTGSHDEA